jgi:hypothetical protein
VATIDLLELFQQRWDKRNEVGKWNHKHPIYELR